MTQYTLIIFSEDKPGLLNHITIVLTRRHVNIHSLTVSPTELIGISRYTIVVYSLEDDVKKLCKQFEKNVEVIRAVFYKNEDTVYQELGMYKLSTEDMLKNSDEIEQLVRRSGARIVSIAQDYLVIEKTGHTEELDEFFKELEKYHILEYVKSGRVSVFKKNFDISQSLKELEYMQHH